MQRKSIDKALNNVFVKRQILQQNALLKCLSSFEIYKAFSAIDSSLAIPGSADNVYDALYRLYEEHYGEIEHE